MPIWHQSPKLTPRYFLETPRLFGYPLPTVSPTIYSIHHLNFALPAQYPHLYQ